MEVVIADSPDYEDLFADICFHDTYWARVIYDKEKGAFVLMIFPQMAGNSDFVFSLDEVLAALTQAKQRLMGLKYGWQDQE